MMDLLPDTRNCALCMHRECQECFTCHRLQRKLLDSDPSKHHGSCVAHVPWCMPGSLTSGGGENVPGIPAHGQHPILGIWQEAHRSYLIRIQLPAVPNHNQTQCITNSVYHFLNIGWTAHTHTTDLKRKKICLFFRISVSMTKHLLQNRIERIYVTLLLHVGMI